MPPRYHLHQLRAYIFLSLHSEHLLIDLLRCIFVDVASLPFQKLHLIFLKLNIQLSTNIFQTRSHTFFPISLQIRFYNIYYIYQFIFLVCIGWIMKKLNSINYGYKIICGAAFCLIIIPIICYLLWILTKLAQFQLLAKAFFL